MHPIYEILRNRIRPLIKSEQAGFQITEKTTDYDQSTSGLLLVDENAFDSVEYLTIFNLLQE